MADNVAVDVPAEMVVDLTAVAELDAAREYVVHNRGDTSVFLWEGDALPDAVSEIAGESIELRPRDFRRFTLPQGVEKVAHSYAGGSLVFTEAQIA